MSSVAADVHQITITLPDGTAASPTPPAPPPSTSPPISRPGWRATCCRPRSTARSIEANRPIRDDATVQLLTWRDPEGQQTFWHSSAHVLAEALEALYPGVKLGIGPAVDGGFYYDVDLGPERSFSTEDFKAVEDKMLELARAEVGLRPHRCLEGRRAGVLHRQG